MVHPRHRSSSTKRMLFIDLTTTSIQVRGFMRKLIRPFAEAQNKTAPKLVHNITLGLMKVGTPRPHSHDASSPLNLTASLIPATLGGMQAHGPRGILQKCLPGRTGTFSIWSNFFFPNDQFRYQQTNFKSVLTENAILTLNFWCFNDCVDRINVWIG